MLGNAQLSEEIKRRFLALLVAQADTAVHGLAGLLVASTLLPDLVSARRLHLCEGFDARGRATEGCERQVAKPRLYAKVELNWPAHFPPGRIQAKPTRLCHGQANCKLGYVLARPEDLLYPQLVELVVDQPLAWYFKLQMDSAGMAIERHLCSDSPKMLGYKKASFHECVSQ